MLFSRFIILYLSGFVGLLYSEPVCHRHESSRTGDVRRCEAAIEMTPRSTIKVPADSRPVHHRSSRDRRTRSVFLLGGQSNMQGLGKVAELSPEIPRQVPHTFYWTGDAFEPLVLGRTQVSSRITDFGPELGLALELATVDSPVYLIKYHASGMPLHHGWDGGKWVGGAPHPGRRNFFPGQSSDDPTTGTLYDAMRQRFIAGLQHLRDQGLEPQIAGFCWMQGEQDSKEQESAQSYATSLRRLRSRLQEDLGLAETLPLVFGQVLPYSPPLPRFKFRDDIRTQMAACDSTSEQPESMPLTAMVSTDDCPLLPDSVHYDTTGQLKLGKELALALKRLQTLKHKSIPEH